MEYWIFLNGKKDGPFSREQLIMKDIPPDTLVWREGLDVWVIATKLPELGVLFPNIDTRQAATMTTNTPKSPPTYLVYAILTTLFCCMPLGILAIIFAALTISRIKSGDYVGAAKMSEWAALAVILSFVIGLISLPIYILMMVLQ